MKGHLKQSGGGLLAAPPSTAQAQAASPAGVWLLTAAALLAFVATVIAAGPDTIGLAALILLAIAGLFFLFGTLAGYVRVDTGAERVALERAVTAASIDACEIAADDGAVLYANDQAMAMRGTRAASIEAALSGRLETADAAYRLARAAERHETHDEIVSVEEASGNQRTVRWLRLGVRPFRAPALVSDARRMMLWTVADISADRQREASLDGRLKAAEGFLDQLPVGVATLAPTGSFVRLNATMRRLLRIEPAAALPQGLADILAAATVDLVTAAARQPHGRPASFDVDVVREDGTAAAIRLVVQPATSPSANWTMLALEQTSDRSVSFGAAGGHDDRFQRLFNGAPFGVATIDQSGSVINANTAFQRMFPHAEGDARSILKVLAANAGADQRKLVEAALVRALAGRVSTAAIDIMSGDASQTARSLHINPLTIGVDPREAAVIYVADATEQKELEMKFAQSQRMEAVGKLAGGIAHDFNNVLTVIIGLADLLLQTRRPTDSGYADLIQIRDNGRRAANMVKQLLAFSRKQTLEPEVIGVNELMQDFAFTFKKTIGEQIDVRHVPTRDLWPVKADRTQLDQVLLNLAVNAKDAMPNGGRLRLRAKNVSERESLKFGGAGMQPGEYVLIEVEDSGTGMTPEVLARVFEPFYTTKDVGKGTGLGLSTVYGIVKQTGGFIYPLSEVGRGTTFRVFLPRHIATEAEEAEAVAAVEAKKKELPRDLTGTGRVLLVEDEDGVRSFAVRALQRQGYEVLEAISGAEALDVLAEAGGKVDLVVSDVIMPEMDGPSMYNEMIKTYPGLKIIFMSGYPSDAFERTLDPKAQFAFLQKPVNLVQLAAKVKEVMAS